MPESLAPGTPREQVLQKLGPPTATWPLADGTRLQYSRQPMGRQVYNVDLDAAGQVTSVQQVLDAPFLNAVASRPMTSAQLKAELGAPAQVSEVGRFDGIVWSWRYEEMGIPRLFHAYIDRQGVARRMYSTDEPVKPWVGD